MNLHQITKNFIDDYGGIYKLIDDLKDAENFSSKNDIEIFESMILYFSGLYLTDFIDIESDMKEFSDEAFVHLQMLERRNSYNEVLPVAKFLLMLYKHNMNFVINVISIKSAC